MTEDCPPGNNFILPFPARLVSGVELNINPNLVLQAFKEFCEIEPQDVEIKRVAVYNGKMEEFC